MQNELIIRAATSADRSELARLKAAWAALSGAVSPDREGRFADALGAWMDAMDERLVARVAQQGDRLVGMAWLVVFERVPNIDDLARTTGDVQSVFVEPAFRGAGVGGRLVAALCDEADRRGVHRVTVHSSARAIPLYERLGFAASGDLLQRSSPPALFTA